MIRAACYRLTWLAILRFFANCRGIEVGRAVRMVKIVLGGSVALVVAVVGWSMDSGCVEAADTASVTEEVIGKEKASPDHDEWRIGVRCGINATYVFAKMMGLTVSYDDVLSHLPVGVNGTSMERIKQYLNSHGLDVEVVQATPASLKECPLPAIALLEEELRQGGHYIVIVGVNKSSLRVIDGTTGAADVMSRALFESRWRGFLIVNRTRNSVGDYWAWGVVMCTGALVCGAMLRGRQLPTARPEVATAGLGEPK